MVELCYAHYVTLTVVLWFRFYGFKCVTLTVDLWFNCVTLTVLSVTFSVFGRGAQLSWSGLGLGSGNQGLGFRV